MYRNHCRILLLSVKPRKKDVENSTEISKVDEALSRDLAKDYPPTPREVVKFYNKLLQCFYNEDCSKSEIEELGGQARLLMDDALLANNPKEQYLTLLESDIQDSKDKGKTISDTTVANSSDIKYQKVKGEECAYVTASYLSKRAIPIPVPMKNMCFGKIRISSGKY